MISKLPKLIKVTSGLSDIAKQSRNNPKLRSVGSMYPTEEKQSTNSHFKDWPNAIGFDAHYEERTPIQLHVTGTIPSYVAGVLFRIGSGPRTVETSANTTFKVNHWFDNFAQIHRFQIHPSQPDQPSQVTYTSRLLSDGLIEKIRKTGKLDGFTFGAQYDPCKSFFKKLQSVFYPEKSPKPNEVNVGVTVSTNVPGISKVGRPAKGTHDNGPLSTLMTKTDADVFQMLDPETLEPIGVAHQKTLHPDLSGPLSAAHAQQDPVTGDVFNYNLNLGRTGIYKVWRASASTGETSVLATIHHAAAYVHSLFLTEHYVVLCVWNSFYTLGGASIVWHKNVLEAMKWDGTKPTTWFVVDKRTSREGGQGLVATFQSDPIFCFHTINSYEEKNDQDGIDIVADLAGYDNIDVISKFYLDNLISSSLNAEKWSDDAYRPTYQRYRLNSIPPKSDKHVRKTICEHKSSLSDSAELPTISPKVVARKHRYVYGVNDSGRSTFADSLVKYDVQTQTVLRWSKHGHTAGEAIFVPDPNSTEEDGGVLLSVVLDGIEGKSYLLVVDAKDLTEIATAHVDGVVGMAFHGLYLGDQADSSSTSKL